MIGSQAILLWSRQRATPPWNIPATNSGTTTARRASGSQLLVRHARIGGLVPEELVLDDERRTRWRVPCRASLVRSVQRGWRTGLPRTAPSSSSRTFETKQRGPVRERR